jgi:hypothetical protein
VVLLHGGYPFVSHAAALAWMYPRVYLDFSVLPSLFAESLARWLEEWLELLPHDKLLFGSHASSPELSWTAAVTGRRQLRHLESWRLSDWPKSFRRRWQHSISSTIRSVRHGITPSDSNSGSKVIRTPGTYSLTWP